jgi:predicted CopG family antitoxin|tara:strand:+ start:1969 stop:2100 length:132 start_codon:yes stop_codon:yes gene_type:complete
MGRNTELIRVRKDILKELLKDKKKGESYSDVLDKMIKIKVGKK